MHKVKVQRMDPNPCPHCKNEIPIDWVYCPHCVYGLNCPNVVLARQTFERAALDGRYQAAMGDASARGCDANVRAFEAAMGTSQAVLGSTPQKLIPIVTRHYEVFATYHDMAELRFLHEPPPNVLDWNEWRLHAEISLIRSQKQIKYLHYAALSSDGHSLPHYGEVTILLREDFVAHRASVFEENSAIYVYRYGTVLQPGSRGTWAERSKLCVAKLAGQINSSTRPDEFEGILLKPGATGLDDSFVEVHVFGPMTCATFQKVTVTQRSPRLSSSKRPRMLRGTTDEKVLRDFCKKHNTECEFV
ncbi:MAG: zinc ribbon domain-containing protein [Planctomycetota bacterium]